MSDSTYSPTTRKDVVFLGGRIKSPPFSLQARLEAGHLLERLQRGEDLSLPHSRPLPSLGPRCHELRVNDENVTWRIIHRVDPEAILVGDVFPKKTRTIPKRILEACRRRFALHDERMRKARR
ncbi:MAG: type II toxin-antitoxin system RelE/ParE family toxin [Longimicrobiaceae bacterium]